MADPVISIVKDRQYVHWRPIRHRDVNSSEVKRTVDQFCSIISRKLRLPWISLGQRQAIEELTRLEEQRRFQEAEAKRQADEEGRRRIADANRRVEEERMGKEAVAKRRAEIAEAKKRAEEEQATNEAEERRKAQEEERRRVTEAKRKEEEERVRKEAEEKGRAEEEERERPQPRIRELWAARKSNEEKSSNVETELEQKRKLDEERKRTQNPSSAPTILARWRISLILGALPLAESFICIFWVFPTRRQLYRN